MFRQLLLKLLKQVLYHILLFFHDGNGRLMFSICRKRSLVYTGICLMPSGVDHRHHIKRSGRYGLIKRSAGHSLKRRNSDTRYSQHLRHDTSCRNSYPDAGERSRSDRSSNMREFILCDAGFAQRFIDQCDHSPEMIHFFGGAGTENPAGLICDRRRSVFTCSLNSKYLHILRGIRQCVLLRFLHTPAV